MNTDTPQTDAETWRAGDLSIGSKVCADFARKLERERDELKRDFAHRLERERDELKRDLADMTEQRDGVLRCLQDIVLKLIKPN
jgi:hypothetical protein